MKRYVDPPGGWRYGFPKELPAKIKTNDQYADWLRKNGYPEVDIPLAREYSRYWEE